MAHHVYIYIYIYRLFQYSLSDTKEHNGSQKLLSKVVRPLDNLFSPNKTKLFILNLGVFNIEIVHYKVEQKASFQSEKFLASTYISHYLKFILLLLELFLAMKFDMSAGPVFTTKHCKIQAYNMHEFCLYRYLGH